MIPNLLLPLIDWNPQFFREVKGRFKPKNIGIAIAGSLAAQTALLLFMWMALPSLVKDNSHRYCLSSGSYYERLCILDPSGNLIINWQLWWFDLFAILSWTLPFLLLVGGVYQLIADLAKEERRGTLNFLRLSPQTSQSILIGKLLGVPLVLWLAAIVAVPLHLWSASTAGISAPAVFSIYCVTLMACGFFYTGAVLYALMGKAQAWFGSGVAWFSYSILLSIWQVNHSSESTLYPGPRQWYLLPINQNLLWSVLFAGMIFGLGSLAFWQAINRRFRNPNLTLISKRQSYFMTLGFGLFLLGLVIRIPEGDELFQPIPELIGLTIVNTVWFLALMAALTPQRQTLLDWARYRQARSFQHQSWQRSLLRDLIGGEKSPALVAIALNLLISITVLTPWIISWGNVKYKFLAFLGLLFSSLFLLICAMLMQSTMMIKSQKRIISLTILLGIPVVILPLFLSILRPGLNSSQTLPWFFSAFALPGLETASIQAIAFGLLAHIAALTILMAHSTHQLRQAGKSELKALLAQRQM
jgi:hypothetical protein